MSDIKVSIVCATYNHENYIGRALEGMINQKTTFNYEILINDDASTDKTAEIVREYEEKYPKIIRAVYQTENQYSKKISVTRTFLFPLIKGEYLAMCEGDDYWIDENKLQKQVDYMDSHPDCSFTCSSAVLVNTDNVTIGKGMPFSVAGKFEMKDFCNRKYNIPYASMLFRTENYCYGNLTFQNKVRIGDICIQMYLLSLGYGYYFIEPMCAYRTSNSASWSGRFNKCGNNVKIKHFEDMVEMYKCFNLETDYRFKNEIDYMILKEKYNIALASKNYTLIRKNEFEPFYQSLNVKAKCSLWLECHFHALYGIVRTIKKVFNNQRSKNA